MARNKERLGAQNPNTDSPPPPLVQENNTEGFSFVVPTEYVDLPSEGKYYPEGHPLHKTAMLEIKQMTAREEDILTSRSLLKKGVAIDKMLQSLVMDKSVDPQNILVGDRNALLVAARISGYGPEYNTQITCPSCGTAQEYSFDLANLPSYDGTGFNEAEVTSNGDGTFITTLPQTRIEVVFRLLTGNDEKTLQKQMETARKNRRDENAVTRQLKLITLSVNGDDSQKAINYLVENMPSRDARHLRLVFKLVMPNVDMNQHFECNECDYDQEMEVPLTADFFWPDR